jgi:L-asparaginase II
MSSPRVVGERLQEMSGGEIIDQHGRVVARIDVALLCTDEAHRAVRAVIAALDAEFPNPPEKPKK